MLIRSFSPSFISQQYYGLAYFCQKAEVPSFLLKKNVRTVTKPLSIATTTCTAVGSTGRANLQWFEQVAMFILFIIICFNIIIKVIHRKMVNNDKSVKPQKSQDMKYHHIRRVFQSNPDNL